MRRLEFCYTPKHGSWLNAAECELSCLTSQCLSCRRIGELAELQAEIAAWSAKTNAKQRGVDWQFRIEDARIKLKTTTPKSRPHRALAFCFASHRPSSVRHSLMQATGIIPDR